MLERGHMVLRKPSDDGEDPNRELTEALAEDVVAEPPAERALDQWASAHGVSVGYQQVEDEREWNATMAVAHAVNDDLAELLPVDKRTLRYGVDESRSAWTDGASEITLTDAAWPGDYTEARIVGIWRTLCHEYAHEEDTEGVQEAPHGDGFNRRYRTYIESTQHVAEELIDALRRQGKRQTMAARGHPLSRYR
jgi:hypothetical protein